MPRIRAFAPAKINLTLHITGQRADGYHLLDSLVAFAPVGDWVEVGLSQDWSLVVDGPEADGVPLDATNLVARAVLHHAKSCGLDGKLAVRLVKNLPPASGLGGGSSDAAAALRAVMALTGTPEFWCHDGNLAVSTPKGVTAILDLAALGADVAMCYAPLPARSTGIGEVLTPVPLPPLPAVLVNPRVAVSTPAVFRALACKDNAPMPAPIPAFATSGACMSWLQTQRNDLQAPALVSAPVIAQVLRVLSDHGAALARMSGSGATCFALFKSEAQAKAASAAIRLAHPEWWVEAAMLGDQSALSTPQVMRATT